MADVTLEDLAQVHAGVTSAQVSASRPNVSVGTFLLRDFCQLVSYRRSWMSMTTSRAIYVTCVGRNCSRGSATIRAQSALMRTRSLATRAPGDPPTVLPSAASDLRRNHPTETAARLRQSATRLGVRTTTSQQSPYEGEDHVPSSDLQGLRQENLGRLRPACRPGDGRGAIGGQMPWPHRAGANSRRASIRVTAATLVRETLKPTQHTTHGRARHRGLTGFCQVRPEMLRTAT